MVHLAGEAFFLGGASGYSGGNSEIVVKQAGLEAIACLELFSTNLLEIIHNEL